jgi:transmembrane sensor
MPDRQTIEALLSKHLSNTLSEGEREQLRVELLDEGQQENFKAVINQLHTEEFSTELYNQNLSEEIIESILKQYPVKKQRIISVVFRWASAAAIIIILGISTYLLLHNKTQPEKPILTKNLVKDIMPGGQKALLTLADGSTILLDSAANGQLATQGNTRIAKNANGEIIYRAGSLTEAAVMINTMSTPNGGQYQLTLADGTKVWLNAASSITYPTTFNEKIREVNITGEAYFEVAQNKSKLFIVKTTSNTVTVLGTAFNINSYPDEPLSKTSLINGSIKINDRILQPGQAYIDGNISVTNLEQDIAWKNGAFDFRNMDTEKAFRQLGRWYNVNIRFAGKVPSRLGGKIGRDLNLSQVLNALKDIGVSTRLENNTLIILPEH